MAGGRFRCAAAGNTVPSPPARLDSDRTPVRARGGLHSQWGKNVVAWSGFAASSTFLLVVIAGLLEVSTVTVSRSTPSHVAQFSVLFDKLHNTDSKRRYVIFIDDLDRCGKKDMVATLERLRTFLGHDRCVFVVAFDRDAIATTIAEQMQHSVPTQARSRYYRTSAPSLCWAPTAYRSSECVPSGSRPCPCPRPR
ncbi:P-loop NTPase fold protein [Microbacterium rhizomatis]|uniref:KAP NTPase domain-containing protein n=1 Tax=Microbacterium rhizomatis TaxID=1631477 RepID=A0A5J5IZH7_9MICO|nr:hypothetical protein F6B43_18940 [Microbacterium rhizomatis]